MGRKEPLLQPLGRSARGPRSGPRSGTWPSLNDTSLSLPPLFLTPKRGPAPTAVRGALQGPRGLRNDGEPGELGCSHGHGHRPSPLSPHPTASGAAGAALTAGNTDARIQAPAGDPQGRCPGRPGGGARGRAGAGPRPCLRPGASGPSARLSARRRLGLTPPFLADPPSRSLFPLILESGRRREVWRETSVGCLPQEPQPRLGGNLRPPCVTLAWTRPRDPAAGGPTPSPLGGTAWAPAPS